MDGRAVADLLAALGGRVAVEDGGQEEGAAGAVELEHLGRVVREREAVLLGPGGDVRAAALEDGDVERVDAGLEDDLDVTGAPDGIELGARRLRDRVGLEEQALEGPVAALLDARRLVRERDDRAELLAATGVLEGGDVVLDTVVVGRERGGAQEADRPVRADEPTAGESRCPSNDKSDGRGRDSGRDASHGAPPRDGDPTGSVGSRSAHDGSIPRAVPRPQGAASPAARGHGRG